MKRAFFSLFVLLIALVAISPVAQAVPITPALSFSPSAQLVPIGNQAIVDVNISGLTGPLALGAYDLNVNFNSSILSLASISFGIGLNLGNPLNSTTGTFGTNPLNVFEVSFVSPATLSAGQPDSFRLFTLTFNTLSLGTSPLSFSSVILGDQNGDPLTATLGAGSITVTPEPSTWLLMASGLVGLGAYRRKPATIRA
jgi:hypothetical protein